MSFKTSLTTTRFYTQFDPYFYTTDNRPLDDLNTRDNQISDELDRRTSFVNITGAGSPVVNAIPTGWSAVRNSAGDYTITHNLNTLSYGVVGSVLHATIPYVFYVAAVTLNTFTIRTVTLAGVPTDVQFSCTKTGF